MVIIFLGAINLVFVLSWIFHGCEQNLATVSDASGFVQRVGTKLGSARGIKVEIFNACGVSNVAKTLADYLRDQDVDVVFYDNFLVKNKIHTISNTIVIDRRSTKRKNARKIARLINAPKKYVIHQLSPDREVDVTILVGKDYNQLLPFKQ